MPADFTRGPETNILASSFLGDASRMKRDFFASHSVKQSPQNCRNRYGLWTFPTIMLEAWNQSGRSLQSLVPSIHFYNWSCSVVAGNRIERDFPEQNPASPATQIGCFPTFWRGPCKNSGFQPECCVSKKAFLKMPGVFTFVLCSPQSSHLFAKMLKDCAPH